MFFFISLNKKLWTIKMMLEAVIFFKKCINGNNNNNKTIQFGRFKTNRFRNKLKISKTISISFYFYPFIIFKAAIILIIIILIIIKFNKINYFNIT